jgi:hypothetical protein
MTSLGAQHHSTDRDCLVGDPVGARLEELRDVWHASLLIEDATGRTISHALLEERPDCAVDAVLSRSSGPLHRSRGAARVTGRIDDESVVTTSLSGYGGTVTVLPLGAFGWLWVLTEQVLPPQAAAPAVAGLTDLLQRTFGVATDPALLDVLRGLGAFGAEHAIAGTWVAAIRCARGSVPAVHLHAALRRAVPAGVHAQVTATVDVGYVVLYAASTSKQGRIVLDQILHRAGEHLGHDLVGACAPAVAHLSPARAAADAALAARQQPGRCLTLSECRPYALLPALHSALAQVPTLGPDPLAALQTSDGQLLATLRAWLDAMGDIPAAAASRGEHHNTFRYRLKRAKALVDADLTDPVARLEIQLRLLAQAAAR